MEDVDEGNEKYRIARSKVLPLPIYKANPETDPDALFQVGDVCILFNLKLLYYLQLIAFHLNPFNFANRMYWPCTLKQPVSIMPSFTNAQKG